MSRLRAIVDELVALVRGEPVLAAIVAGVAADVLVQLQGDGLNLGDLGRIIAVTVLGVLARSATTPAANPKIPMLPTEPPMPAPVPPVRTLTGRRA